MKVIGLSSSTVPPLSLSGVKCLVLALVFVLRSKVLDLRGFDTRKGCSGDGDTALLRSGEVWGDDIFLLLVKNSSLVLMDFL